MTFKLFPNIDYQRIIVLSMIRYLFYRWNFKKSKLDEISHGYTVCSSGVRLWTPEPESRAFEDNSNLEDIRPLRLYITHYFNTCLLINSTISFFPVNLSYIKDTKCQLHTLSYFLCRDKLTLLSEILFYCFRKSLSLLRSCFPMSKLSKYPKLVLFWGEWDSQRARILLSLS